MPTDANEQARTLIVMRAREITIWTLEHWAGKFTSPLLVEAIFTSPAMEDLIAGWRPPASQPAGAEAVRAALIEARFYVKAVDNSDDPGREAAGLLIERIDAALAGSEAQAQPTPGTTQGVVEGLEIAAGIVEGHQTQHESNTELGQAIGRNMAKAIRAEAARLRAASPAEAAPQPSTGNGGDPHKSVSQYPRGEETPARDMSTSGPNVAGAGDSQGEGLEPPGCPMPGACSCPGGEAELARRLGEALRTAGKVRADIRRRALEEALAEAIRIAAETRATGASREDRSKPCQISIGEQYEAEAVAADGVAEAIRRLIAPKEQDHGR